MTRKEFKKINEIFDLKLKELEKRKSDNEDTIIGMRMAVCFCKDVIKLVGERKGAIV